MTFALFRRAQALARARTQRPPTLLQRDQILCSCQLSVLPSLTRPSVSRRAIHGHQQ